MQLMSLFQVSIIDSLSQLQSSLEIVAIAKGQKGIWQKPRSRG